MRDSFRAMLDISKIIRKGPGNTPSKVLRILDNFGESRITVTFSHTLVKALRMQHIPSEYALIASLTYRYIILRNKGQ